MVTHDFSAISEDSQKELTQRARLGIVNSIPVANFMHLACLIMNLFSTPYFATHLTEGLFWSLALIVIVIIRITLSLAYRKNSHSKSLFHVIHFFTLLIAAYWPLLFYRFVTVYSFSYPTALLLATIVAVNAGGSISLRKIFYMSFTFSLTLIVPTMFILIFMLPSPQGPITATVMFAFLLFSVTVSKTTCAEFWKSEINYVLLGKEYKKNSQIQKQIYQSSKLASIGTLASGVAHELNNPLTGILGFIELIIRHKDQAEYVEDKAQKIKTASLRMKSIIDQLRQFSRQTTSKDWKNLEVKQSIANALILLEKQLASDDIRLVKKYDNKEVFVWGNCNKLESIFHNMISNAKDAFENVNDERKKEIIISIEEVGDFVRVIFQDNASGIPKHLIERIYDPFFTTKPTGKGTGLGLAITHSIIKEHNGSITINSTEDVGTTFTISLPKKRSMIN